MAEEFSNSIVAPENLPEVEIKEFNPIDRKYLKLIYIRQIIFLLIMGLSFVAFIMISDEETPRFIPWIFAGSIGLLFCYSFIITWLSFPYRGYLIREKDIAYKRGLLRFKLTSIPFKRIQHVELIQGVLAKRMNLASIKVYTAGGSSDDLSIPGLNVETARQIREFLTEKINADD